MSVRCFVCRRFDGITNKNAVRVNFRGGMYLITFTTSIAVFKKNILIFINNAH